MNQQSQQRKREGRVDPELARRVAERVWELWRAELRRDLDRLGKLRGLRK